MSFQYPDRITIEDYSEVEVSPHYARMKVSIVGESLVFGDEALKKSRELAEFIKQLDAIEYTSDNVSLENVVLQTGSGKIVKSSSVRFLLLLDKVELDKLPRILGVIANQRNIEIIDVDYELGNLSEEKTRLYEELCLTIKQQALRVTSALDIDMIGIYSLTPRWIYPFADVMAEKQHLSVATLHRSRSVHGERLEGLDFVANQKGKLILHLKAEIRISEFTR